jgi:PAS domain S-box-containing protein
MPNMDGLELSKQIRNKTDKPIIIFTGQGSEEVASRAFSIGVNSYIKKDVHPSIYEVLINEIHNNHERYINSKIIIESEKKYRTFLESSLDGITFNVNTEIKFCNLQAADLLGYTKDELIGMSVLDVSHPDSIDLIEERTKLRQKGEIVPEQYSVRLVRKDGSIVWVELHSGLVEFEGEVGSLTVIRDISERMKYELRLEKLSEYSNLMVSVKSLKSLYQITYEILDIALGFEVFDIVAVKDGYLEDVKRAGLDKERFKVSLDGPGITVRAALTGETQIVNDIRLDVNYISGPRTDDMLSELVVPVFVTSKVFLVLNVESENVNAFSDHDKKLLEIFGRTMGSTIERLLFNNLIHEKIHHLENELDTRARISLQSHQSRSTVH